MPGKGTTARNVRIPDDEWTAAQAKAAEWGVTLSEVVRKALQEFTAGSLAHVPERVFMPPPPD